uniref:Calmegin isoform X1 n=2 Tax=Geotrypetes seraphini TaxID=260995 RepID=A0A6P8R972_GEOSA|nr:calmegin isoform X1 [Geotrypetes seraphini]XP_033795506.1 calmegin isoform X1 [Geotrypetes seraphini]XP_033795516.1 calmegin isoform X1 [Geotrypetes seraphini]
MKLKWEWICLGILVCSSRSIATENEADTEVNFDNSKVTDIDEDVARSLQVDYKTPVPIGEVYLEETFDDGSLDGWVFSKMKKDGADDDIAKYDGRWEIEELKENKIHGDKGLVLKSAAKHHAISAMLKKPFIFDDKPLIVQYEVNFQDGIDCGGAYVKLLSNSDNLDLEQFFDKTPYTIMFGPDKCGEEYKLHFIFRHKNPKNGVYEEKHAKRPEVDLKTFFTDKKTHLYTLILGPDNTFEILIDQTVISKGNLLEDMVPPVNPASEINDPFDKKPEEWDERAKIPDITAIKPDDWDEDEPSEIEDLSAIKPDGWLDDESEYIPDLNAQKPEDWDDTMDGEWEPPQIRNPKCETAPGCGEWNLPLINNPKYKGKWKPPMIENPNYQGIWSPRKIHNPDYFEDLHPFLMTSFSAIGLELWSMTSDIYFDNFIICLEKEVANHWAFESWGLKKLVASANEPGIFRQMLTVTEEHPWMWIIYILTIGLLLGMILVYCWPKKKTDEDIKRKQADSVLCSIKAELEQEKEEIEKDVNLEEEKETSEKEHEGKSDEEPEAVESREEECKENRSPSDDEMNEADESPGSGDGPTKSIRKRRVRKD